MLKCCCSASLARLMHSCSKELRWNISKPKMSSTPIRDDDGEDRDSEGAAALVLDDDGDDDSMSWLMRATMLSKQRL